MHLFKVDIDEREGKVLFGTKTMSPRTAPAAFRKLTCGGNRRTRRRQSSDAPCRSLLTKKG